MQPAGIGFKLFDEILHECIGGKAQEYRLAQRVATQRDVGGPGRYGPEWRRGRPLHLFFSHRALYQMFPAPGV
jgi:hypothetical protein